MTEADFEVARLCAAILNESILAVDPRLPQVAQGVPQRVIPRSLARDLRQALTRLLKPSEDVGTHSAELRG